MTRATIALAALALCATVVSADPGTGLLVLADGAAVFGDPERNIVWRIDADGRVRPLVRDRHSHLLRLERDGAITGEHLEYIAAGARWRTSFWRLAPGARTPVDVAPPVTAAEPFPDGTTLRTDAAGRAYSWRWLDGTRTAQQLVRRDPATGALERLAEGGWRPLGAPDRPRRFGQVASIAFTGEAAIVAEVARVVRVERDGSVRELARRDAFPRNPRAPRTGEAVTRLWGSTVDAGGTAYVSDGAGRQVLRLAPGRAPVAVLQLDDAFVPIGVALGAAGLYVLEAPDPGTRAATGLRVRIVPLDQPGRARILGATPAGG